MNWHAVYTKPRTEFKAADFFEKLGLECYVPYTVTTTKLDQKLKHQKKVLISGMLFFKMSELNFDLINSNPHTKSIVRNLSQPAVISELEINTMKDILSPSTHDTAFDLGSFVSIDSGVFSGEKGQLLEHRGNQVWVNLPSLQLKVCLCLESNKITAA